MLNFPVMPNGLINEKDEQAALEFTNARKQAFPVSYYTSDAADERSSVDLGGRRIIKQKTRTITRVAHSYDNISTSDSKCNELSTKITVKI